MEQSEPVQFTVTDVITLLAEGALEVQGMLPWSSNYTLLAIVRNQGLEGLAVYKPRRGERPLWDFPPGTLCQREVAAYLLSETLGWTLVPPTVLRDGPYGVGSVQLFIDADQDAHLFTMQKEGRYQLEIERLAAFDVLANNVDRKSGHCLRGLDGRLWAIDHGVCFHAEPKLRTVLWDFAGQPLRADIKEDLCSLRHQLQSGEAIAQMFAKLLVPAELQALVRRVDRLIEEGCYPAPGPGYHTPWPLI